MSFLENKVPPPIVMLFSALLVKVIADLSYSLNITFEVRISLAILFVLVGVVIDVSALICFRKAKTTINPLKPDSTSSLVIVGIYRYTRNPMYLGMLFILLGVVIFYASPISLIAVMLFMAYISRFQIVPEERAMQKLFSDSFTSYRQQVRRWL